jgi:hypothetical protein
MGRRSAITRRWPQHCTAADGQTPLDARDGEKRSSLVVQFTHPVRNLDFDRRNGPYGNHTPDGGVVGERAMGLREKFGDGRAISRTVQGVAGSTPAAPGAAGQARSASLPSPALVGAGLADLRRAGGLARFRSWRGPGLCDSRPPRQMLAKQRNGFFDFGIVDLKQSSAHPQIPAGSGRVAVGKRQRAAFCWLFHGGVS